MKTRIISAVLSLIVGFLLFYSFHLNNQSLLILPMDLHESDSTIIFSGMIFQLALVIMVVLLVVNYFTGKYKLKYISALLLIGIAWFWRYSYQLNNEASALINRSDFAGGEAIRSQLVNIFILVAIAMVIVIGINLYSLTQKERHSTLKV